MEWFSIDSAPKDGERIIVSNRFGVWMAEYKPFYSSGAAAINPWFSVMLNHWHMDGAEDYIPTHWMPLPPPPSKE